MTRAYFMKLRASLLVFALALSVLSAHASREEDGAAAATPVPSLLEVTLSPGWVAASPGAGGPVAPPKVEYYGSFCKLQGAVRRADPAALATIVTVPQACWPYETNVFHLGPNHFVELSTTGELSWVGEWQDALSAGLGTQVWMVAATLHDKLGTAAVPAYATASSNLGVFDLGDNLCMLGGSVTINAAHVTKNWDAADGILTLDAPTRDGATCVPPGQLELSVVKKTAAGAYSVHNVWFTPEGQVQLFTNPQPNQPATGVTATQPGDVLYFHRNLYVGAGGKGAGLTPIAMGAGWGPWKGSANLPPSYYVTELGLCVLTGVTMVVSGGADLGTLPAECRPASPQSVPVFCDYLWTRFKSANTLAVSPAGALTMPGYLAGNPQGIQWVPIDSVAFPTAAFTAKADAANAAAAAAAAAGAAAPAAAAAGAGAAAAVPAAAEEPAENVVETAKAGAEAAQAQAQSAAAADKDAEASAAADPLAKPAAVAAEQGAKSGEEAVATAAENQVEALKAVEAPAATVPEVAAAGAEAAGAGAPAPVVEQVEAAVGKVSADAAVAAVEAGTVAAVADDANEARREEAAAGAPVPEAKDAAAAKVEQAAAAAGQAAEHTDVAALTADAAAAVPALEAAGVDPAAAKTTVDAAAQEGGQAAVAAGVDQPEAAKVEQAAAAAVAAAPEVAAPAGAEEAEAAAADDDASPDSGDGGGAADCGQRIRDLGAPEIQNACDTIVEALCAAITSAGPDGATRATFGYKDDCFEVGCGASGGSPVVDIYRLTEQKTNEGGVVAGPGQCKAVSQVPQCPAVGGVPVPKQDCPIYNAFGKKSRGHKTVRGVWKTMVCEAAALSRQPGGAARPATVCERAKAGLLAAVAEADPAVAEVNPPVVIGA